MSPFTGPWKGLILTSRKFSGLQALGMSQNREGISTPPALITFAVETVIVRSPAASGAEAHEVAARGYPAPRCRPAPSKIRALKAPQQSGRERVQD